MKRSVLLFSFLAGFILSGCTTADLVSIKRNYNFSSTLVNLDEVLSKSDPRFIDRLLRNLELPLGLVSKLSYNDRISVVRLDSIAHPENRPQLFAVDRALIEKLISRDYIVVERNEQVLAKALAEGSSDESRFVHHYLDGKADSSLTEKRAENLYYATKLLAYRILELGITEAKDEANNNVMRIGRAEIELRLIDANTSRILFSDIATAYILDTLSESEHQILKGIHYKFAPDALPLVLNLQAKDFINVAALTRRTTLAGEMVFLFTPGNQLTHAYIADELSNELVQSFDIPSSAKTTTFEYRWDLKDREGKLVKPGYYSLWLNDIKAQTFKVGE